MNMIKEYMRGLEIRVKHIRETLSEEMNRKHLDFDYIYSLDKKLRTYEKELKDCEEELAQINQTNRKL